ncbi:MAG: trypsin-like serine protease [Pseudomonadota bacterium]|nr:trypsin-like serine protease [Pseudomonadota bacterium]
MTRYLLLSLLAISSSAGAIVVRSDVDDARYHAPASVLPALADLPGQGHGVLIAPQWVLTAAHLIGQLPLEEVTIDSEPRRVERIVVHPGYTRVPEWMVNQAHVSGDTTRLTAFMASRDDLALVKLVSPIDGVAPLPMYRGADELGQTVELIGKGATGNGTHGELLKSPLRTRLRRAFNVVEGADGRWLSYTFDSPPAGLPLEGSPGTGDSGTPVIVEHQGRRQLAGLGLWNTFGPGKQRALHGGLYGQVVYAARISRYGEWIESVMSAYGSNPDAAGNPTPRD